MSLSQLKKILHDLNSTNEKLKILALMHTPRLSARNEYPIEDIQKLHQLVEKHLEYPNPDIAFLSRKAFNFLKENLSVSAAKNCEEESDIFVKKEDKNLIFSPNSINDFSIEPFEICNQLDLIPESFRETRIIVHFLTHANSRVQAAAIEAISRICPIKEQKKLLTPFLISENNRVRANAIMALGIDDFSLVAESLGDMLNTTRISMRESAVFAIGKLPPNLQLQNLLLQVLHDPYRDIRLRVIEILQNYPSSEVVLQMRRLSNDMDIEICEKSAQTLTCIESKLQGSHISPEPDSENEILQTNEEEEEKEESDIWDITQKTKDYSKQSKDGDYDEFVGDDDSEFLELNPLQDSFEIESNFIDVPKVTEEKSSIELATSTKTQDKPTEDILFDLFATEQEEKIIPKEDITDLFAVDEDSETTEAAEAENDFFNLDNAIKSEKDLEDIGIDKALAENEKDSEDIQTDKQSIEKEEEIEIEDLFVIEKETDHELTHEEDQKEFNFTLDFNPEDTTDSETINDNEIVTEAETTTEFEATIDIEDPKKKIRPQPKKESSIEELIRLYKQKQQRERVINDWNIENFFSSPEIKTPAEDLFEFLRPKPTDIFARLWLRLESQNYSQKKPEAKKITQRQLPKTQIPEKSIQIQINELLREVGAAAFHLLSEQKTSNEIINAVLKNLAEKQKQLRFFYQSKPPKNQQNDLKSRSLQKAVQDSFLALGRSCLQEIRHQRFNLPQATSYQKRLQTLVSQLNSTKNNRK